jgi:gamma-glutamylcyclotransferase (GGCT)/AIG2-like uncharacterized protein YtfP
MHSISLANVSRLIADANAVRGYGNGAASSELADSGAEARLESLFPVSRTLAVYGTLAPGRSNHHVVAPLGGEWTEGVVEGDLSPEGWGATLGFPAFRARVGGPLVSVHVLTAARLADAWAVLDDFEGPGYRRILVPVLRAEPADDRSERRLYTVANLYAAAPLA